MFPQIVRYRLLGCNLLPDLLLLLLKLLNLIVVDLDAPEHLLQLQNRLLCVQRCGCCLGLLLIGKLVGAQNILLHRLDFFQCVCRCIFAPQHPENAARQHQQDTDGRTADSNCQQLLL